MAFGPKIKYYHILMKFCLFVIQHGILEHKSRYVFYIKF